MVFLRFSGSPLLLLWTSGHLPLSLSSPPACSLHSTFKNAKQKQVISNFSGLLTFQPSIINQWIPHSFDKEDRFQWKGTQPAELGAGIERASPATVWWWRSVCRRGWWARSTCRTWTPLYTTFCAVLVSGLSCGQTLYGILTVSRKYHSRDRMFSGLYVVIAGKIQVLPISLRLR